MMLNLFGIIGATIISTVQAKANLSLLRLNKMIAVLCLILTGVFWFSMVDEVACLITVSVLGFTIIPILFIAYELAVEQACQNGLGEATPCGIINMMANGIAFVVILVVTPILSGQDDSDSYQVLGILGFL